MWTPDRLLLKLFKCFLWTDPKEFLSIKMLRSAVTTLVFIVLTTKESSNKPLLFEGECTGNKRRRQDRGRGGNLCWCFACQHRKASPPADLSLSLLPFIHGPRSQGKCLELRSNKTDSRSCGDGVTQREEKSFPSGTYPYLFHNLSY